MLHNDPTLYNVDVNLNIYNIYIYISDNKAVLFMLYNVDMLCIFFILYNIYINNNCVTEIF